MTKSW